MFFNDHEPPHFHAEYGEHSALIDIQTLAVIGGRLPSRAMGLTIEWASAHQDKLMDLWGKAKSCEPLQKIEPLQ
jgi:hypothetical protein